MGATVEQDLIQEFETIKGQYIIHFNEVFRVVGLIWSESAFDYYWLLYGSTIVCRESQCSALGFCSTL